MYVIYRNLVSGYGTKIMWDYALIEILAWLLAEKRPPFQRSQGGVAVKVLD